MYFPSDISIHALFSYFSIKILFIQKLKSNKDYLLLIYTFMYVYNNISKDNK